MLSIVIPSFNRRDSILVLLENIFSQEDIEEFEVIVVDDQSPDDTNEHIRQKFPSVRLLVNEKNSGPAVSRNNGVKAALGEIIVGFDSDVSLRDSKLLSKVAAKFAAEPSTTGIAFRLLTPGDFQDDSPRWWHSKPLATHADKEFETAYFSGTGYAFRKREMLAAGLYPEILYMHYEEVVLAYRLIDDGGTLMYDPSFEVVHHAGETPRRNRIKMFFKPRNQLMIAKLCMSPWLGFKYVFPRFSYNFMQSILHRYFLTFFSAMKSYASLRSQCIEQRKPLKAETWARIANMK